MYYPAKALSVSKDMRGELAAVRIARDDGEEIDRELDGLPKQTEHAADQRCAH